MDLYSLINEKKKRLKSCKTVITDTKGHKYEIVAGNVKQVEKGLPFVIDMKPDLQVACIMSGLFLSSQDPAVSIEILKLHAIRHILSIGVNLAVKFEHIQYYYIDLLDLPESNIFKPIQTCIQIIHSKRHENILVHCNAGVSRSPAIVISYLMALECLSYEQAYQKVKAVRNCIRPNDGFDRQLKQMNLFNLFPELHISCSK